jgi:hypothetical protein
MVVAVGIAGGFVRACVLQNTRGEGTPEFVKQGTGRAMNGLWENQRAQQRELRAGTRPAPQPTVTPPGVYQPEPSNTMPSVGALPIAIAGGLLVFLITGAAGVLIVRASSKPTPDDEDAGVSDGTEGHG